MISIFFTAGYPELNLTVPILKSLQLAGADMVEIGIPFSDPLADGPTIQESSEKALRNGMKISLLFDQLSQVRNLVNFPILLMGYLNPVMQFGIERFCSKCQEVGIDGLILPDLPLDVYEEEYKKIFAQYGLHNIFLITPQTSNERIHSIDRIGSGFIYVVSTHSTTGGSKEIRDSESFFTRIEGLNLTMPRLIGFNVKDSESFAYACSHANGAIVGSAFVKSLQVDSSQDGVARFVHNLLQS